MGSSIIFLGTAGDEYTVGKQIRSSGGIVIKVEGYQFHLDPGPGALVKAANYGINLRENTAVLVSHSHINHCNDLNAVLAAMSRNCLDIKGVLIASESVVNGDEENKIMPYLTRFHRKCVERVIVTKPGQRIGIQNIEIQALPAYHKDRHAVGFKIFTPEFVLTYSSDTRYSKDLAEHYKKSDILILNTVYPSKTNEKEIDNLTTDDVIKIVQKARPKLLVLTHFGNKMLQGDPLYEAREIQNATGVQVLAAADGMVVNPVSYSANAQQKTLNSFQERQKAEQKPLIREIEPNNARDDLEEESD
jgi:ribonuclease BN (tRNA processing enzyme)